MMFGSSGHIDRPKGESNVEDFSWRFFKIFYATFLKICYRYGNMDFIYHENILWKLEKKISVQ